MDDPHQLQRFIDAQAPLHPQVQDELRAGRKSSHWMWFVFPQFRGLGHSEMAWRFGIGSRAEALAYVQHPLLGARLRDDTTLMLAMPGRSALQILGTPDDQKFKSSMTLFAEVAPDEPLFRQALTRFFAGHTDLRTLQLLADSDRNSDRQGG